MSTTAQDQPLALFEGGTLEQPYMPGPGWLEPQHSGVDVGLVAGSPVRLPAAGTYDQVLSTGYSSVFDLPGGGYEQLLHISPRAEPTDRLTPAGSIVGAVSPLLSYPGTPFWSKGPHVHIGEYAAGSGAASVKWAGTSGSIDPTGLLSTASPAPTPTPSTPRTPPPTNPIQGAWNAITGAAGSAISAVDPAAPLQGAIAGALGGLLPPDLAPRAGAVLVGALLLAAGAVLLFLTHGGGKVVEAAL